MLNTSFWESLEGSKLFFSNGQLDSQRSDQTEKINCSENRLNFYDNGVWSLFYFFDQKNDYQFSININTNLLIKLRIYFLNLTEPLNVRFNYSLAPNAKLEQLTSNENSKHLQLTNQINLAKSSNFNQYFQYTAPMTENNDVFLADQSVLKTIGGNYLLNNTKIQQSWHINHLQSNSESHLLVKNVLDDQALATFYGLVKIPNSIEHVITNVQNKNLLLSSEAKMITKPQLEINAEEVIATHGASIGNVSPEAIFYLQSRGFSTPEAIALLTKAFLEEIYELFPIFA